MQKAGDLQAKLDDDTLTAALFDFGGPVTRYSCFASNMNITFSSLESVQEHHFISSIFTSHFARLIFAPNGCE